mgnify:CR=1 FL=1
MKILVLPYLLVDGPKGETKAGRERQAEAERDGGTGLRTHPVASLGLGKGARPANADPKGTMKATWGSD